MLRLLSGFASRAGASQSSRCRSGYTRQAATRPSAAGAARTLRKAVFPVVELEDFGMAAQLLNKPSLRIGEEQLRRLPALGQRVFHGLQQPVHPPGRVTAEISTLSGRCGRGCPLLHKSILLSAVTTGRCPAPSCSISSRHTAICLSQAGLEASTTCSSRSACDTSSSVEAKGLDEVVGQVANQAHRVRQQHLAAARQRQHPGSRGSRAKSLSSAKTPAPVSVLSRVDLPALV